MSKKNPTPSQRKRQRQKQSYTSSNWYHGCEQKPTIQPKKTVGNTSAPAFYRSAQWRGLRGYVLKRDGDTCQYCGSRAIQADHVIPRKAGGPDEVSNLVACCTSCNATAGGNVFISFDEKKTWILTMRKIEPPRPTRFVLNDEPKRTKAPVVQKRRLTGLRKTLALKNQPEHVREALPVESLKPRPAAPLLPLVGVTVVWQAQDRDGKRCIVCKAACRRVVRVSLSRAITLSNAATMCMACEKAARSIPPDESVTIEAVRARRTIGT
jgi:hypothetical protein